MKNIFSPKILKIFAVLLLLVAAAIGGWYWYLSAKSFELNPTEITEVSLKSVKAPAAPSVDSMHFLPDTVEICFDAPLFKPGLDENELNKTLALTPPLAGKWGLRGDTGLSFRPKKDWVPGEKYSFRLPKSLLSAGVRLPDDNISFNAPEFAAQTEKAEFYEAPQDVTDKRAVASFFFTYPLATKDLESKIKVTANSGKKYDFTYNLTDGAHRLHVMSSAIKIAPAADFINIEVADAGNAYNDVKLSRPVKATVAVPAAADYFRVLSAEGKIAVNEQRENRPEQVLPVVFSTAVRADEVQNNIVLKEGNTDNCLELKEKFAALTEDKKAEIFASFAPVPLVAVEAKAKDGKTHVLRFDYTGQKCLAAKIGGNMRSLEGYTLGADYFFFFYPPQYPTEAKIAFDGALLSLKGDKNLPLVSRGADKLFVKLARIPAENINHLATQTAGGFAEPYFLNRYSFNEDNIAEVFEKEITVNMKHPADETYSSIELDSYFREQKGIFLIRLQGSRNNGILSAEDVRLVVITDLGLIVKDNADGTHALWVSSIAGETPVAGAKVEVLGQNGRPIVTATTDAEGYVLLPDFSAFQNDKRAAVYKVSLNGDVSFLPINRFDRRLDLSRFDVGGEYDNLYAPKDLVEAFGFSDRGIYRPGESAHFGLMVRQKDLRVPSGLPLNIEILTPDGKQAAVKNVWADSFGFVDYTFDIPQTAALGRYMLNLRQIRDDNEYYQIASTEFNVQEFNPDTMRLKLQLNDAPAKGWYLPRKVAADVDLQNLYGNPAGGHRVRSGFSLTPVNFTFAEYPGYVFRDPLRAGERHVAGIRRDLPETTTDKDGQATLEINLDEFSGGAYRLDVWADGLELAGGRGVSAEASMLVSANPWLVGYKADGSLTNIPRQSKRTVNWLAVDNLLTPSAKDRLTLSLVKRGYEQTLVQMPDRTYRYRTEPVETKLWSRDYALPAEGADYTLPTTEPGEYILVLTDESGREAAKIFYSVAGGTNADFGIEEDAGLKLSLDKKEYQSGDVIRVQMTAPYAGYGLVTIERDRVYAWKWFKSDKPSAAVEITLPEGVEGNAYVNAAWVRSLQSDKVFAAPLSYAAAPFDINKAARELKITLAAPAVVKPGQELVVNYQTDYPAEIILYGVNTGILQVADYKLPDPLAYFLPKKALQVATMQILDLILPDMEIVRYLKGVGGDGEAGTQKELRVNPFARRRDAPVAFWSGILPADEKGGVYRYRVPENFNGEIRLMAVSASAERMGKAERAVAVRGDFALTPSGPWNVSPGDEFTVGLAVANMLENTTGQTPVEVRLTAGAGLAIVGRDKAEISLAAKEEGRVFFRVKALERLGSATLAFVAENKNNPEERARISYDVGVRPANAFSTRSTMGYTASGKLELTDFVLPMYAEECSRQAEASASPLVLTTGLLDFLEHFPHSCTEQSVSKIFPAMEIFFNRPELVEGTDIYALYDDVIAKLAARQTIDGSFRAWPSAWSAPKEFDSLYALNFLIEAKKNGFEVPAGMFDRALSYARKTAARKTHDADDSNPAYAAYLLTLNGEVTSSYLLKIEEELNLRENAKARSSLAAAYLAAANLLLKNESGARALAGNYEFGQNDADNARYLYLAAKHPFGKSENGLSEEETKALLQPLKNGNFTTIQSAWSLLALNAIGQTPADVGIAFDGVPYGGKGFAKKELQPTMTKLEIAAAEPFYYAVNQQGYLKVPVEEARSDGLEINKKYLDKEGRRLTAFAVGDEITVEISLRSLTGGYVNDVAVTDLLPGCLEMVQDSVSGETDNYELREDRALLYLSAAPSARTVRYRARVTAEGSYVVPAVFAEALYDPSVAANSAAGRMLVIE